MRKIQTTPQDRAFYNEHAGNLSTYRTVANLGQLLSAASLSLAVFTLLSDAIAGRGITATSTAVTIAAVLIGVFVELANRMLARPSIRPLVVKDQFVDNEEKRQRHKLVTRFSRAGLFAVGLLSFVLSFMGSMDAGQLMTEDTPPPALDSLQLAFTADTTTLLSPYTIRANAARQQFEATEAGLLKAADDYSGCARRGNKWCKKKQRGFMAKIDVARADYNATTATIATERGQALTAAIARRDADRTTEINTARAAADVATAKATSNGYIFAVLTAAGQVVFYLMLYLILQIEAGSEITEDLQPNEFHNQPSVVADLKAVVSHRVERGARRLIRKLFGDRDRLTDGLPYVQLWDAATTDEMKESAAGLINASIKANEDFWKQKHAPGFYRAADDPHTPKDPPDASVTFNTPKAQETTTPHTKAKDTKKTPVNSEVKAAQQRLMQYRRRVGKHTQKAKAQKRKTGTITSRTAEAIANNQRWVDHYTKVINDLSYE